MGATPAAGRWNQENQKFKVILGYILSSRLYETLSERRAWLAFITEQNDGSTQTFSYVSIMKFDHISPISSRLSCPPAFASLVYMCFIKLHMHMWSYGVLLFWYWRSQL